ncbi:unnamed protein product [Withania somnifera]
MTSLKKLTIFFFLSICLSSSWANNSTHDDFLECLSHKIRNSNSKSQVIFTPKNSSYSTIYNSFTSNLRITSDFKPSIIITPNDESQIQAAVHCSKKHGLQIRIRSGGHDFEGLSYISENPFFIIDLSNTEEKTAWIQAGTTLGEVYYRIAEKSKKLAFVAGVCPTVGVGGHFSGGGYSMMSRKFGGGGTSFGLIISWKVKLLDIPKKMTAFNVNRTLEQNATQLIYKCQHIADKVNESLLLKLFLRTTPLQRGQRAIHAFFRTMFVGGVKELLQEMQKSFPELGLGASLDVLLNWNTTRNQTGFFKGKSDYFQRPISINGIKGIWKLFNQLAGENSHTELQLSPYGGKLSDLSESEISFPHRAGTIFMIHYAYVSKSPRAAYFNYRDLDLGVNNKGNTSYAQARIWGVKYFKNNFDKLVAVKTKVDPTNFFRNEQSIPPLLS